MPVDYYLQRLNELYNVDDRHGQDTKEYSGSVASAIDRMHDSP